LAKLRKIWASSSKAKIGQIGPRGTLCHSRERKRIRKARIWDPNIQAKSEWGRGSTGASGITSER